MTIAIKYYFVIIIINRWRLFRFTPIIQVNTEYNNNNKKKKNTSSTYRMSMEFNKYAAQICVYCFVAALSALIISFYKRSINNSQLNELVIARSQQQWPASSHTYRGGGGGGGGAKSFALSKVRKKDLNHSRCAAMVRNGSMNPAASGCSSRVHTTAQAADARCVL